MHLLQSQILKIGVASTILFFTSENSSAKGFLSWVGDHIPIFGQIKQAAEIAERGRKDQWEMEEEAADPNSQKDPNNAIGDKVRGIRQIGVKGHEAVGAGYRMVGGRVMPGVTKVAGDVVDGADKINRRVERAQSLWEKLFGRDNRPKDVDQSLNNLPDKGSEWAEPQDGQPSVGSGRSAGGGATDTIRRQPSRDSLDTINSSAGDGAIDTIRQTDIGRSGVESTGGGAAASPPPPAQQPGHPSKCQTP